MEDAQKVNYPTNIPQKVGGVSPCTFLPPQAQLQHDPYHPPFKKLVVCFPA